MADKKPARVRRLDRPRMEVGRVLGQGSFGTVRLEKQLFLRLVYARAKYLAPLPAELCAYLPTRLRM